MILIPLVTIPLIFLFVALFKPYIQARVPWNICAICVAVALTWLFLLSLAGAGIAVDSLLIGVLMGMSVTGVMYKIEVVYKAASLKHLWATRLVIILGGFYTVVLLLQRQESLALLIGIGTLLLLAILSFLLQGVTHAQAVSSARVGEDKKSLLKKLDNCC